MSHSTQIRIVFGMTVIEHTFGSRQLAEKFNVEVGKSTLLAQGLEEVRGFILNHVDDFEPILISMVFALIQKTEQEYDGFFSDHQEFVGHDRVQNSIWIRHFD